MANQIRVHTSVEVVNDSSEADTGTAAGDYTNLNLDAHADFRSWGGTYNIATDKHGDGAYNDDDICYWKNAVVDITSSTLPPPIPIGVTDTKTGGGISVVPVIVLGTGKLFL